MTFRKSWLYTIAYISIISFITATLVANRDLNKVVDNVNYMVGFQSTHSLSDIRDEYLFGLLTYIIHIFTDNYVIYFYLLNLLLNFFLILSGIKISNFFNFKIEGYLPLLFSTMLLSSWYITSAGNALRQGLALAILYYSLILLTFYNNRKKFLILYLSSCLFHYSNFLLFPFFFLMKLKYGKLFIFSIVFAFLYLLNINEILVLYISEMFRLPLYHSIKDYADITTTARYGFQWDLFIYTSGLSIIYYLINTNLFRNRFDTMIKIYFMLTIPYYIFGFAGFSNRYGIPAWLFSIFINSTIVYNLFKFNNILFLLIFVFMCFFSLFYFSNVFGLL